MHGLARWMLVPVLRVWATSAQVGLDVVPRPTDAPQAHSAGIDSDRVLLVGAGLAVGWGVLSHDLALPGALARALTARTGRGVDVDVLANPRMTVSTVRDEVNAAKLWRYDAIVLALGVNEAVNLAAERTWRREMSATLRILDQNSSLSAWIFVAGMQPVRSIPTFSTALGAVAERHARALNRATALICADAPRTSFIPLTASPNPSPDRFRSKDDYRHWAEILAPHLAAQLDAERLEAAAGLGRSTAQDAAEMEEERRRAVETLRIIDTDPEHRFDRIVALAQRAFGTRSAAFGVSDGGRLWGKATVGEAVRDVPRSGSLSDVAIAGSGALVVADTLADERFRDHPLVLGEPYTRFYAGYPVESPSGERIGVLCVFDPEPRPADAVDTVLLREFALMLQRELLRHPRASGSTSIASQGGNPNATLARDQ